MPQAIKRYLEELRASRRTGAAVPETLYYQPLANLLNAIGADLEPPVLCVINPANRGAGIPDGGLFTDQAAAAEALQTPQPGRMPERGVIDEKPVADDAFVTADSSQI